MPFPKQKAPIPRPADSTSKKAPPKSAASKQSASTAPSSSRFDRFQTDPRFKLPSKKHTHTKLDKRFRKLLDDEDFSRKAKVDRYGRRLEADAGKKDIKRLYEIEGEEDSKSEDGSASGDSEHDVRKELKRVGRQFDPAREGGFSDSSSEESSSSDEDEEDGEDEVEEAEIYGTEEQAAQIPEGEVSKRIAVVNMDWDNVRAVDIMAVALSFLPPEGRITDVAVYPSDFGRERMDREELEGPPKEIFAEKTSKAPQPERSETESESESDEDGEEEQDEDSEDEEERIKKSLIKEDTGEEYNSTALRKYQLDRLRYYYAVISCSSPEAAKSIYDSMDGREYLSSANFFDLRFVPDDVTFDEKPRDDCSTIPRDYKPSEFVTEALRHSKVKLTWDAEDRQRKEVQKRAFSRKEIDENDLQAYIGSGSSSEEDESDEEILSDGPDVDTMSVTSKSTVNRQAKRDALRAALSLGADSDVMAKNDRRKDAAPVGDMEVSFVPGLSANENQSSVFQNDPRDIEETTMERYIRKEKERKQRRKERSKARREGQDPDAIDSDGDEEEGGVNLVGADGGEGEGDVGSKPGDLGFDDPFFTDPMHAEKEKKRASKEAKAKNKLSREAEDKASRAQRAELELLMAAGDGEEGIKHFDMRDIRKAEKAAAAKGNKHSKNRKNKYRAGDVDVEENGAGVRLGANGGVGGGGDDFEMNVQDPRFSRLFESHEFAIDPTNPRFKGTQGMKKMLEEARRKRAAGDDGRNGVQPAGAAVTKEKKRGRSEGDNNELSSLVEKVKKKAKKL